MALDILYINIFGCMTKYSNMTIKQEDLMRRIHETDKQFLRKRAEMRTNVLIFQKKAHPAELPDALLVV